MTTDGSAGEAAGAPARGGTDIRDSVATEGTQGRLKPHLMFPKAQQGGSHSPGTAGIRLDPGLERLSVGFPWDVSGTHSSSGGSREQGKPLCSLGVQRRQENLGVGFFWGEFPLEIHIMEWCLLFFLTENP